MGDNMKEFDRVIGYEDVKVELERIIDMMINTNKYKKLGVRTIRGLLLEGDPGLGKTLMANCFIKASKRKAFTIRKDIPNGDFVKHIKATFDEAKKAQPSIVFLDDVDKFANEDSLHRNAEEFVTIQSCIDDCKEDEVFVLATANETDCLPSSLLRVGRFDKTIEVVAPTGKDAEEIIRYYLSNKKIGKDVDVASIARLLNGRSCADLETVINEAGVYAGYENKKLIDMNDFIRAYMRVAYNSPENLDNEQIKCIRSIAVHEAGHAVVGETLEPGSINLISVKKYHGNIGGITSFKNNDDYFLNKDCMENRVISLLAGKAATEVVLGKNDVGSNNDIHRAFDVVTRFVDDYCCYGFQYFEGVCTRNEGNDLLQSKQKLVSSEMEKYYQKAKTIIIENKELLDKLVEALIDKKVLVYNDIQTLKASCSA